MGPPQRPYITVNAADVEEANKKNLIWMVAHLQSSINQKISGWSGFNISIRGKKEVSQDVMGYLPTINTPATEMTTIHEVLDQSQKVMNTLQLNNLVVVFD